MAITIICQNKDPAPWVRALKGVEPELDVRVFPNDGDPSDVKLALTWLHPQGALLKYPGLKAVFSMGAGIDHINQDPDFPKHLPVARVVDPELANAMFDYLVTVTDSIRHHSSFYREQQSEAIWSPKPPLERKKLTIGILGLGQLGGSIATRFAKLEHPVVGWSNSEKTLLGVEAYCQEKELKQMLRRSQILINLLPLTDETRAILNRENLSELPNRSFLINVGRGLHLVEDDLLFLLDSQKLAGAYLDVFQQEPLPSHSALWRHPKIVVTPHVSSLTSPESVASQILENYHRVCRGQKLINQVDLVKGY